MKKLIHSRDWGILMTAGFLSKWYVALLSSWAFQHWLGIEGSFLGFALGAIPIAICMGIAEWIKKKISLNYEVVRITKIPDGFDFFEQGEPQKRTSITIKRIR